MTGDATPGDAAGAGRDLPEALRERLDVLEALHKAGQLSDDDYALARRLAISRALGDVDAGGSPARPPDPPGLEVPGKAGITPSAAKGGRPGQATPLGDPSAQQPGQRSPRRWWIVGVAAVLVAGGIVGGILATSAGGDESLASPSAGAQDVALAYAAWTGGYGAAGKARVANIQGRTLATARPRNVASMAFDTSGNLWLAAGIGAGYGSSGTNGCDLWAFPKKAPSLRGEELQRELIQQGALDPSSDRAGLLCWIYPAPGGGVATRVEGSSGPIDVRIQGGGAKQVTTSPVPVYGSEVSTWTTWDGGTITVRRDPDTYDPIESDVPGVGTVPGEVRFVGPKGDMLLMVGGFDAGTRVVLRRKDGSRTVLLRPSTWTAIDGAPVDYGNDRVVVEDGAISRDGRWALLLAYTGVNQIARSVIRVPTSGSGNPVVIVRNVARWAVPQVPVTGLSLG